MQVVCQTKWGILILTGEKTPILSEWQKFKPNLYLTYTFQPLPAALNICRRKTFYNHTEKLCNI